MNNCNEVQNYRLSIPDKDRQRVENATFNLQKLEEVNSSKYPHLARILDARSGVKRYRLKQILEYLARPEEYSQMTGEEDDRREFTDIPIKELTGKYGGSARTYESVFNLLCACGMAIKHNPNVNDKEHKTFIDNEARNHASRQRNKKLIKRKKYYSARVYYHIPQWTDDLLRQADALAQERTGTLTQVIDIYGRERAQTVLDTYRNIPHDTQRARERIDKYVSEALRLRGYTTKAQIMKAVHVLTAREVNRRKKIKQGTRAKPYSGRKTVNLKPILTAYIPELCKKYSLTYKQPTKEQMREYSLTGKTWIITGK